MAHGPGDDAAAQRTQMKLTCCIGSVVCPDENTKFMSALEHGDDVAPAYAALEERVARYWHMAKKVQTESPHKIVE
jgi:hypothetical protein